MKLLNAALSISILALAGSAPRAADPVTQVTGGQIKGRRSRGVEPYSKGSRSRNRLSVICVGENPRL